MASMLSLPAYTDEMFQQGQTSITPGQSLFKPSQLSLPGPAEQARDPQYVGMPDDMYNRMIADQQRQQAFADQNGGLMIRTPVVRDYEQWMMDNPYTPPQQQPSPYGGMTPGDALGGGLTMPQPTPVQQLNTPSFTDIAQTQPFVPPTATPMPMATQPPATQAVVQQIQAPTTNMPTPSVPVVNQPPATQQLIQQIKAPTATRAPVSPPPMPNLLTNYLKSRWNSQPPQPRPQIRPQPMIQPRTQTTSLRAPMARSVSRINPPLLPTRPTGRR